MLPSIRQQIAERCTTWLCTRFHDYTYVMQILVSYELITELMSQNEDENTDYGSLRVSSCLNINSECVHFLNVAFNTGRGASEMYWSKSETGPGKDNDSLDSRLVVDCSQWVRIVRCFSIQRNGAAILNLEDGKNGESLAIIHGLRVVTMAWIIMGHTYGLVNPQIHSKFQWLWYSIRFFSLVLTDILIATTTHFAC